MASTAMVAACTVQPASDEVLKAAISRRDGQDLLHVAPQSPADQQAMAAPAQRQSPAPRLDATPDSRPMAADFTIIAPHTLSGSWTMTHPTRLMVNSAGDAFYSDIRNYVCRFEQTGQNIAGSCVPGGKEVSGSLSGDQLKLGWSRGLFSARINGVLDSATHFQGGLTLGMMGVQMTSDLPANGDKIVEAATPDDSLPLTILRGELAAHRGMSSSDQRALGEITTIAFLAEIPMPAEESRPEGRMSVFDVEFAQGWRLCGVRLDAAQKLEMLDCR